MTRIMDGQTQYWVAPDGSRHPLTAQQVEHLTAMNSHASQPHVTSQPSSSSIHPTQHYATEAGYASSSSSSSSSYSSSDSDASSSNESLHSKVENANYSEPDDDKALDEDLAWIPRNGPPPAYSTSERLLVPVVIPQVHAGIKHPFSRGWAPILESRGVRKEEFLQFIDHLNVCKAASPPLKMLMMAGHIVGYTPVPFGFAVSAGTTALAVGGMFAVGRYRIGRYLKRANQEYFFPRGLFATVAKQKNLAQFTGLPADSPNLAPTGLTANPGSIPTLRDRRLQAMGEHIAPIQYENGPASTESNFLDRWTSKSSEKQMRKSQKRSSKQSGKHQPKAIRREMKIERKLNKARKEGKVDKIAKLEHRLEVRRARRGQEGTEVTNLTSTEKEEKLARKFMFVVVGQLDDQAMQALKQQVGK